MTTDYRHEAYRKELMRKEINEQCVRYDSECKYLGSHIGTKEEINSILNKVKKV